MCIDGTSQTAAETTARYRAHTDRLMSNDASKLIWVRPYGNYRPKEVPCSGYVGCGGCGKLALCREPGHTPSKKCTQQR